jgi:hypothetical protein
VVSEESDASERRRVVAIVAVAAGQGITSPGEI